MSYEQFWDESPCLAVAYRKSFRLKRQIENEQAWLQGFYVYNAFGVCMANAFAKPGAKKQVYLDKPIDIFPLTEREKKFRQAQENAKMEATMKEMIRKQQLRKKQKGD